MNAIPTARPQKVVYFERINESNAILQHLEIIKIQDKMTPYLDERYEPSEAVDDITPVVEEILENRLKKEKPKLIRSELVKYFKTAVGKKTLLKTFQRFDKDDVYLIESLITQLEARKRQLKANFKSETPQG